MDPGLLYGRPCFGTPNNSLFSPCFRLASRRGQKAFGEGHKVLRFGSYRAQSVGPGWQALSVCALVLFFSRA